MCAKTHIIKAVDDAFPELVLINVVKSDANLARGDLHKDLQPYTLNWEIYHCPEIAALTKVSAIVSDKGLTFYTPDPKSLIV